VARSHLSKRFDAMQGGELMAARRGSSWTRRRAVALAAATIACLTAPTSARAQDEPFRDPRLPMSARVDDLMSRLTVDEKIALLHQYQPAIPRLGIGVFKAGTEALHGVAWSNDFNHNGDVVTARATAFPQALGLASTWDPTLLRRIGSAVGDEARGLHAQNPTVWGLNLWAPVVNLLRDPRWGRNEEGYSEDPVLTSAIAIAYGSGLQGDDRRYLKTAPTLKHFLAYNNEVRRDVTSSNVRPRVLHEYDEQAFEPAIRANAATGIMASYNLLNGRPMTVSPLNARVRSWTSRTLFNVSDAFAPYNLTGSQAYFATQAEANAAMFKSGLDSFTADNNDPRPMIAAVKQALDSGLMTLADVERAGRHALSVRLRLGEFDPGGGPYGSIGPSAVNAPAHQRLARRAAGEAAVLLKNDRRALPLTAKKVAVVGPLANTVYSDWYGGSPPYTVTPAEGIAERAQVTASEGVDRIALKDVDSGRYVTATGTTDADAVAATATSASEAAQFDAFDWGQGVLTLRNVANGRVLGYGAGTFITRDAQPNGWFVQQQFKLEAQPDGTYVLRYAGYETQESWFGDKTYVTIGADGRLALGASSPAGAARFAKTTVRDGIADAVAAARGADAAVVVVGSMPFINGREAHDRTTMALAEGQEALVKAVRAANANTILVVENSYPDTLTWEQDHVPAILWTTHAGQETGHAIADVLFGDVNPAGRLTQTWYRSDTDLPSILDYDIIASDRTYQYFRGTPLYAFGHGLSYTRFRYGDLRIDRRGGRVVARVRVRNAGGRAGDEVVQLYTRQRGSQVKRPLKTLRAFARVHLAPGQTRWVRLAFRTPDLAIWDVTRSRWAIERGLVDVMVGGASDRLPARASLLVRGERIPPRNLSRPTRAQNWDDQSGTVLVDETKVRGTAVAGDAGGWLRFARSDLGAGAERISARVAKATAGDGAIVVRLDDPRHGRVVGTVPVPSTGDRYAWTTVRAPLARARGVHDVYLTFTAPLALSRFEVGR
jgi:beta-glucosidase